MNSIVVNWVSTDRHFEFDPSTRVELLFRAALAGSDKEVAIGLRLAWKKNFSEVVWFEPRISALEICTDYKRLTKIEKGVNSFTWARDFVESLVSPEIEHDSRKSHSSTLERLSAEHFTSLKVVVNFDPYSLDDDAKVDIFFYYRKTCLSLSVQMEILAPFVKSVCFCSETRADRHCLLCRGR